MLLVLTRCCDAHRGATLDAQFGEYLDTVATKLASLQEQPGANEQAPELGEAWQYLTALQMRMWQALQGLLLLLMLLHQQQSPVMGCSGMKVALRRCSVTKVAGQMMMAGKIRSKHTYGDNVF